MEYLWTPQPKGKFLFEWAIFFITRNRRQVQFLSFWFIGAFIAEHNHLSQVHFSSSRWPFGPFGRTVYLGLSCGLCTKSCTKCRKRDRIIHNLMKQQFAVYRSIAPMMNQDITIKWANRASPDDEAYWPVNCQFKHKKVWDFLIMREIPDFFFWRVSNWNHAIRQSYAKRCINLCKRKRALFPFGIKLELTRCRCRFTVSCSKNRL